MKDSEKEDLLYRFLGGIVVFVACVIVVLAAYLVKAAVMVAAYMASGGAHILCMLALVAGIIVAISACLYRSGSRKCQGKKEVFPLSFLFPLTVNSLGLAVYNIHVSKIIQMRRNKNDEQRRIHKSRNCNVGQHAK